MEDAVGRKRYQGRVGVVAAPYPLKGIGGARVNAAQELKVLLQSWQGVLLFTEGRGEAELPAPFQTVVVGTGASLFSAPLVKLFHFDPFVLIKAVRFFTRWRPRLVSFHEFASLSYSPLLAVQLCGIPSVVTLRTFWPVCLANRIRLSDGRMCEAFGPRACAPCLQRLFQEQYRLSAPQWVFEAFLIAAFAVRRALLKRVSAFVAPSERAKSMLIELGVPEAKVRSIPNALAPAWLDPKTVEEEKQDHAVGVRYSPADKVVLFVGRLSREKGLPYLLQAFAIISRQESAARLLVVGAGPDAPLIHRLVSELGVEKRVVLWGSVPHEAIRPLYAAADVCVVPSLAENCPTVVLEALAMAVPTVLTSTIELEGLVHGRNCLQVDAGDPEGLAEAITALLRNPQWARQMGTEGRNLVIRQYANSERVSRLFALYDELLSHRAGEASQARRS